MKALFQTIILIIILLFYKRKPAVSPDEFISEVPEGYQINYNICNSDRFAIKSQKTPLKADGSIDWKRVYKD